MSGAHVESAGQARGRQPEVSVLMAVFNGERYIRLAIDSVLSQDFRELELIIVDDGSADGTPAIIRGYEDDRIVYVRNPTNLGQTRSLNVALARSRAPLLCRIDADDVFLPGKVARQFQFMMHHPDVVVCGTWAMRIDAEGRQTGVNRLPTQPLDIRSVPCVPVPVCHVSVMMRRNDIVACGGYSDRYRYAADFALWSSLLKRGSVITNVPEVLVQDPEFGESFGAGQKVGAAGAESAEIIQANARDLAGVELTAEESRGIALFYFPAAGMSPTDLCLTFQNLGKLARAGARVNTVEGRPRAERLSVLGAHQAAGVHPGAGVACGCAGAGVGGPEAVLPATRNRGWGGLRDARRTARRASNRPHQGTHDAEAPQGCV